MAEADPNKKPDEKPAADDWKAALPEDIRESQVIQRMPDIETMAKSLIETKRMADSGIRIPSEEAAKEVWDEFSKKLIDVPGIMRMPEADDAEGTKAMRMKLGMPEEKDGYEFPDMEDSLRETLAELTDSAHENGLTKNQYKNMLETLTKQHKGTVDAQTVAMQEDEQALRTEWGGAYDSKVARAALLAKQTGAPEGLVKAVEAGKADSNTMKWLDSLSDSLKGEGTQLLEQPNPSDVRMTPQEAEDQINDVMSKIMENGINHPDNVRLGKKMVELEKFAHPDYTDDVNAFRVGYV